MFKIFLYYVYCLSFKKLDTFSQLSQLQTLCDDTRLRWVSYRRCVTTHGFVSGRSGKKREIGFHWLEYFLDASDASSIQPWPNRTCIVAADSWTDRAIALIARFLSNIRKSVRVISGYLPGGVRHDPQRFMGKTVTAPHFNRDTVEFASRKRNESNLGIKTLLPFPKNITEERDFENF